MVVLSLQFSRAFLYYILSISVVKQLLGNILYSKEKLGILILHDETCKKKAYQNRLTSLKFDLYKRVVTCRNAN